VEQLRTHRELLALLLVWEIGKALPAGAHQRGPLHRRRRVVHRKHRRYARRPEAARVDLKYRLVELSTFRPRHSLLVQMLCGNAVIAKTPTDGGIFSLTLSLGLARQCGLPVSLVSGSGGRLSDALVRNDAIACLAFVGGRARGENAASLFDQNKRLHAGDGGGKHLWHLELWRFCGTR